MKLKNKKTGEIGYLIVGKGSDHYVVANNEWNGCGKYDSLAELNEEWEDYEEPKEYWFIDYDGDILCDEYGSSSEERAMVSIGNRFENKEEAKKVVEKLKAWKRLKDKEFRFINHTDFDDGNITIWGKFNKELDECDVDLLFGGEE